MQIAELTPLTRGIIMDHAKYIGRIGALALALGVGFAAMVPPGVSLAEEPNCGKSSAGSPTHPIPSAAQTGINPVLRDEQSDTSVALAIPEVSQLASVAFNPLWPLAVLFFVVVIPVFAVLLFFFPPVFPAIASAVSAIPEPLDPPVYRTRMS